MMQKCICNYCYFCDIITGMDLPCDDRQSKRQWSGKLPWRSLWGRAGKWHCSPFNDYHASEEDCNRILDSNNSHDHNNNGANDDDNENILGKYTEGNNNNVAWHFTSQLTLILFMLWRTKKSPGTDKVTMIKPVIQRQNVAMIKVSQMMIW